MKNILEKLILVRYGEHENEHLTERGKETMQVTAEKLEPYIATKDFKIVSAEVSRAIESAQIIAHYFKITKVESSPCLYAAEEENIIPDISKTLEYLISLKTKNIVAIVSREYIEILPGKILGKDIPKINLQRGQVLFLDLQKRDLALI